MWGGLFDVIGMEDIIKRQNPEGKSNPILCILYFPSHTFSWNEITEIHNLEDYSFRINPLQLILMFQEIENSLNYMRHFAEIDNCIDPLAFM